MRNTKFIFSGDFGYFIKDTIPPKRLNVLKKLFTENGGTILKELDDEKESLIFANVSVLEKIPKSYKSATNIEKRVISVEWISSCMSAGKKLGIDDYRIMSKDKLVDEPEDSDSNDRKSKKIKLDSKSQSVKTTSGSEDGSQSDVTSNAENSLLDPSFKNTKYACQRKTPLESHNKKLISLLKIMEHSRYLQGNSRSELSYRRAIASLKAYPRDIQSAQEASQIQNIGPKISSMIEEYLRTGKINEVEKLENDDSLKVLDKFAKIYGVGPKQAQKWYNEGKRTLKDIEGVHMKVDQSIGLKYFDDFNKTMTRSEVEEILGLIKQTVDENVQIVCQVMAVGGYRRGKINSNDLDVLIGAVRTEHTKGILHSIVEALKKSGHITDVLFYSHDHEPDLKKDHSNSVMDRLDKCFCAFVADPKKLIHRRVDIILAPASQFPFAILGWSGSRQFERSIRDYARKEKNVNLSSQGILDLRTGETVQCKSEEEIFKYLGLEYIEPEYRNC